MRDNSPHNLALGQEEPPSVGSPEINWHECAEHQWANEENQCPDCTERDDYLWDNGLYPEP